MGFRGMAGLLLVVLTSPGAAQRPTIEFQSSGTTARLQAVSAVDDRIVWASGTHGTFVRTTDGGTTWHAGVVAGADSLEFRDVHGFDADKAVLLASGPGEKSRLYRTEDGGRTWALMWTNPDPKGFFDCFDFVGPFGVLVGDATGDRFPLLATTNGGRSWTTYTPPGWETIGAQEGEGAFAASGTCLVLTPDRAAWVGTAKGGRVIRFGRDRADVWVPPIVRDAPGAGISTLAVRPGNVMIAAGGDLARSTEFTDNVVVSKDGGQHWSLAGRPPFTGSVYGSAFVPSRPGTLVAVSPKGAAWSGDDGGTWSKLDDGDYWGIAFTKSGTGWIAGPAGKIARIRF